MTDSLTRPLPNILSIHLTTFDVHCLLVYRPPSNLPPVNDSVLDLITEFCSDREVILVGDFNLPSIIWDTDPPSATNPIDRAFLEAFTSLGLTQWVNEATYPRSGNILDLVLTSETDRIGLVQVLPPIPGCDHSPTEFEYNFTADLSLDQSRSSPHRHWHKGNFHALSASLGRIDWDLELSYLSAENSFKHLASILHDLVEEFVPLKANQKSTNTPWLKRPPTSLINLRHAAWEQYKNARHQYGRHSPSTTAAYASFQGCNSRYRNYTVSCQADYEENIILRSKENPKLLHSYIRNKKVGRPSIGPIRLDSGRLTDAPGEMVEVFASSFASVYTKQSPKNPYPYQCFDGSIDPISFPVERVLKVLQNLDGNTSMGPDNLHPILLKCCATQLAYPLHLIFTRSLSEGRIPSDWKSTMVIPIFNPNAPPSGFSRIAKKRRRAAPPGFHPPYPPSFPQLLWKFRPNAMWGQVTRSGQVTQLQNNFPVAPRLQCFRESYETFGIWWGHQCLQNVYLGFLISVTLGQVIFATSPL